MNTFQYKPVAGIKSSKPQINKKVYVPPHLRNQKPGSLKPNSLHDNDELPENMKPANSSSEGLSKSAAKNKKRRDKKKLEESNPSTSNVICVLINFLSKYFT